MMLVNIYKRERVLLLFPVDYVEEETLRFLYDLLADRDPWANISHRQMPEWDSHVQFVMSMPYAAWYTAWPDNVAEPVGTVYLTHDDEIGVHMARKYQSKGYGREAVRVLMTLHPRARYLANIAPANIHSQRFFRKLGFEPLQHTYEFRE